MALQAALKAVGPSLSGFLPVYKPKNICCNKILACLKYDLHFVLKTHGIKHGIVSVSYAKGLNRFAEGLMTFIFGSSNYKRRNFAFADYIYQTKVEFGVERLNNIIGGDVLGTADTSLLNRELIESVCQEFIGPSKHSRVMVSREDQVDPKSDFEAIYNVIQVEDNFRPSKQVQKYPLAESYTESSCEDIKLVEYSEPYATFNITCQKNFYALQFVSDLASRLGTKASIVELKRLKEGPMYLDDMRVSQLHELNLELYAHKLDSYRGHYISYLQDFDNRFENAPARRCY